MAKTMERKVTLKARDEDAKTEPVSDKGNSKEKSEEGLNQCLRLIILD